MVVELAAIGAAAAAAVGYGAYRKRKGGSDESDDEEGEAFSGDPIVADCNDDAEDPFYQDRDRSEYEITGQPEDPTPEVVTEKEGLTDVKGIGDDRAADLVAEGFETPEDLYYAADKNLTAINGIGEYTVGQIREDIGGVDEDPSGESNDEESVESSPSTDETSDADSDQSGTDSEETTGGSGNGSDEDEQ